MSIRVEGSRKLEKVFEMKNALNENPDNKKITRNKTTQETLRPTETRKKYP